MPVIVPPGGFAGFQQQTPASRAAMFPRGRASGTRTRKRRTKAPKVRKARRAKRSGGKMKFGSPAWQKKYKVGAFRKG